MRNLGLDYDIKYLRGLYLYTIASPRGWFDVFFWRGRYMGKSDPSEALLTERLETGLPTLFYLWTPHQRLTMYNLSRIQLPMYKKIPFENGRADYPSEVLEKVASKKLSALAPRVQQLVTRFSLDNSAQGDMLQKVAEGLSTFQTACDRRLTMATILIQRLLTTLYAQACDWLKKNEDTWSVWLPEIDQDIHLALLLPMTGTDGQTNRLTDDGHRWLR